VEGGWSLKSPVWESYIYFAGFAIRKLALQPPLLHYFSGLKEPLNKRELNLKNHLKPLEIKF
jgi:hypothetical protein